MFHPKNSPLLASLFIHLSLMVLFLVMYFWQPKNKVWVNLDVLDFPESIQEIKEISEDKKIVLKSINTNDTKKGKEVFGASREALTDSHNTNAIDFKEGNTILKKEDKLVLTEDDPTNLPAPTDEYLVTSMPSVLSEVRPDYPILAKEKGLEGKVMMDVLIDKDGNVRQVKIIEGDELFHQASLSAMKLFKFRPAQIDSEKVAVRIRYTLNFKLEY